MELATLQEKSRTDKEEKLRMSKALLCKKEFLSLSEEVDPEVYIKHAFRCTQALGALAKSLSPGASRELLAGTFTPRSKTTKPYMIPRSASTSPGNQEAALAWSGSNFPPVIHKHMFNIGREECPKVGNILNS